MKNPQKRISVKGMLDWGCLWPAVGVLVGGTLFVALLLAGPLRTAPRGEPLPTPMVMVIPYVAPTATPTDLPAPETPTPSPTPAEDEEGMFIVGELVQVQGTGGDSLRLRSSPSLSAEVVARADQDEVLEVGAGPVDADGYRWWFLTSAYNPSKQGWAVGAYLGPLLSP